LNGTNHGICRHKRKTIPTNTQLQHNDMKHISLLALAWMLFCGLPVSAQQPEQAPESSGSDSIYIDIPEFEAGQDYEADHEFNMDRDIEIQTDSADGKMRIRIRRHGSVDGSMDRETLGQVRQLRARERDLRRELRTLERKLRNAERNAARDGREDTEQLRRQVEEARSSLNEAREALDAFNRQLGDGNTMLFFDGDAGQPDALYFQSPDGMVFNSEEFEAQMEQFGQQWEQYGQQWEQYGQQLEQQLEGLQGMNVPFPSDSLNRFFNSEMFRSDSLNHYFFDSDMLNDGDSMFFFSPDGIDADTRIYFHDSNDGTHRYQLRIEREGQAPKVLTIPMPPTPPTPPTAPTPPSAPTPPTPPNAPSAPDVPASPDAPDAPEAPEARQSMMIFHDSDAEHKVLVRMKCGDQVDVARLQPTARAVVMNSQARGVASNGNMLMSIVSDRAEGVSGSRAHIVLIANRCGKSRDVIDAPEAAPEVPQPESPALATDDAVFTRTVARESTSMDGYELENAVPNPFNGTATIAFSIGEAGRVKVSVFDEQGARVAQPLDDHLSAGRHSIDFDGSSLPSGRYFYTITAHGASGDFTQTKSMQLVK
jgi:hypothetical protein